MSSTKPVQICRVCGQAGTDLYCSHCGTSFRVKRITGKSLLHDVFHLFTHLDKGFGFTLKQLVIAPGTMQKQFIEGDRAKYQQPFSMFFICATIAAVSRYWINLVLHRYYQAGDLNEAHFFHQYMVLLHMILLPFYALVTWLFFKSAKYNYGESAVLMLYSVSFFFILVSLIALLKFIWPDLDTAYIELPLLTIYNIITYLNFYKGAPRLTIIIKSVLLMIVLFMTAHYIEKFLIGELHA